MMKKIFWLFFILCSTKLFSANSPFAGNDSLFYTKQTHKLKLARLIDSVLELPVVTAKEIELLKFYASNLKEKKLIDSTLSNLNDLISYSDNDEHVLFPSIKLDSLPISFTLMLENKYLGYYFPPIRGVVTSHFGWRDGRKHKGIDLDLNKGDEVSTVFDGKVRFARYQGGYGNVVVVIHPNGLETVYAHLSKIKVKEGDIILSGQTIGLGGNTGHSFGSHLHFELRYKGYALNPETIISFTENNLYHHTITIKNTKTNLYAFPSNSNVHHVNKGESWNAIAIMYGLSLKELMTLNGVGTRHYLKVGEPLKVN